MHYCTQQINHNEESHYIIHATRKTESFFKKKVKIQCAVHTNTLSLKDMVPITVATPKTNAATRYYTSISICFTAQLVHKKLGLFRSFNGHKHSVFKAHCICSTIKKGQ